MSIKVYGTNWCGGTRRVLRQLDEKEISYTYIDIDQEAEAAEMVKKLNNGNRSVPTLVFEDGTKLTEPGQIELDQKLASLLAD